MISASGPRNADWKNFEHPVAFWLGAAACIAGVALHIPMYYSARSMGYRMAGMRPDGLMVAGMVLIVGGLLAAFYGVLPRHARLIREEASQLQVQSLDDVRLRPRHVAMLIAVSAALVIDAMKPAALSFVAPGMAEEYGLKAATNPHGGLPVALLPLFGISGTVLGSWLWGWMADRIGRRSSIIIAGMLFVTTSICGAMPSFYWNLAMCFAMGIGAGGMLPITFALLAETIPARHRSWLIVLVGGGVTGLGYVLTSWLAGTLIPQYSWRILWLIGLPTGVLFIALNRWIPESPRFLIAVGRTGEAERVLRQFGAEVVQAGSRPPEPEDGRNRGFPQLFGGHRAWPSLALGALAIGTGLVTYGFQLWIPTNLQHLGLTTVSSDYVVRNAALIGLPLAVGVTILYGFWSSKKTLVASFGVLALDLLGFVMAGDSLAGDRTMLTILLVIPLSGTSLAGGIAAAYASELYPTRVRSRGTGLTAGATKLGGVLIIALAVATAATPSIPLAALIGALPLLVGSVIFALRGRETRGRHLEDIGDDEAGRRAEKRRSVSLKGT